MKVFVLDTNYQPLAPTTFRRARRLLRRGKAAVWRRYPFTVILKRAVPDPVLPEIKIKIEPGSKTTGLAVVNQATGEVILAAEIEHRGETIKRRMQERAALRRSRRNRKTRYRKPRFLNRRRIEGQLPPSLKSRVENIATWVKRINRVCPVAGVSLELAKFDTQKMQDPEITGVEYQQGELAGYEVREYLLEKFGRRCVYCGKENVPLEVEHIVPLSRGGSNRVSNLALACRPCNQAKGNKTAEEFGHPNVAAQAKKPLKDAAVVNATRYFLLRYLKYLGFAVECSTGARTKNPFQNSPQRHGEVEKDDLRPLFLRVLVVKKEVLKCALSTTGLHALCRRHTG